MEKICNRFTFLTLENYINQPAVVFGVSDCGLNALILKIKVTETDLQTDEGKPLPILETLPILKTPNPQDSKSSRLSQISYITEHHSYAISVKHAGWVSNLIKSRSIRRMESC